MNTKLSPLAGFILGITHFWASSEKKAINHQISNKTLSGKTRLYGMLVIPLLMLGMITLSYKAQAQTENHPYWFIDCKYGSHKSANDCQRA